MNGKVKIRVSNAQLDILNSELSVFSSVVVNRGNKLRQSILKPLALKFIKKRVNDNYEHKKITVTLSFYEAHYLEEFLKTLPMNSDSFRKATIGKIIFELNQKLA